VKVTVKLNYHRQIEEMFQNQSQQSGKQKIQITHPIIVTVMMKRKGK